jgi:hypothetical protein
MAQSFPDAIKERLGVSADNRIPKVAGTYRIAPGLTKLHPGDVDTFQQLYDVAPNKGVGNGEVSLFWLYNWGPRSNRAQETRGGNDPDLRVDGKNVEVKAYGKHNKISLGRFQDQKVFRELISTIFAVDNLMRESGFVDVANFKYKDLSRAAEHFCSLRHMMMSDETGITKFPFFRTTMSKIQSFEKLAAANGLNAACYSGSSKRPGGERIALELSKYIIRQLLGEKPGDKGYMLNTIPDYSKRRMDVSKGIMLYKVDLENMESSSNILGSESPQTFTFNGGAFSADFQKLFGKITTP